MIAIIGSCRSSPVGRVFVNHPQIEEDIQMGIIAWIFVGLIGGFLASKVVNHSGEGLTRDILLGIVGAVVGGWIFNALGEPGATGVNIYSIVVAFIGGVVVLVLYHALFGKRT
jgi:uncharacterized membrane protein YeaQ/YmgE (transglycosylase-associated protein family)